MGQLDGRVGVLQFPKVRGGGGDGEAPVLIRVKGLALRWRCVCACRSSLAPKVNSFTELSLLIVTLLPRLPVQFNIYHSGVNPDSIYRQEPEELQPWV